jgi:hypothetical protein
MRDGMTSDLSTDELNASVAEKVMGWKKHTQHKVFYVKAEEVSQPMLGMRQAVADFRPAERIADAWLVVERMREIGWLCTIDVYDSGIYSQFYRVGISKGTQEFSDSAPRAVCLAALKALGGGE